MSPPSLTTQAIFPTFSFMSHSCAPNCGHSVFPNKTLALQAKHEIKAGEEFTISYISPLQVVTPGTGWWVMSHVRCAGEPQKAEQAA